MKSNPKVSIIIPVYKGKDFMREAIDSALAQTYKNIEIIVVNDGSDDNGVTKNIAESYGTKIRYFEKENGGVSTALNLAIDNMTGDYFSWLSHDDRYYPNKIESQIKYLKQFDEKTILYSDYDLMDENSNVFARSIKDHNELTEKPEYALLRGSINGITLLIPKQAFKDCGYFREDLRCTQDYELWFRMFKKYKFVHQPEILGTTRLHKNQTGNTNPNVLKENNELWINLIESVSDKDKIRLEGTIYMYYYNMLEFIKTTNFDKVKVFLEKKVEKLEKELKKEVSKKLVSVIIPYYNNELEIGKAIDSVMNQTHKLVEIIIIDDGSKNRINKNEFKSKNIKILFNEKNMGVSSARNKGIKEAKGEYIAFLDADDEFISTKIDVQLLHMLKYGSSFSYTSYVRQGKEEIFIDCSSDFAKIKRKVISNCDIATPTVMIEKKALDKYKIKYRENLKYGEDVIFYLDLFKYVNPTVCDEYLSIVHVNENSAYLNVDKQIEGTKNILKYLFTDEEYNKYIIEISKLCNEFYKMLNPYNLDIKLDDTENKRVGNIIIYQSRFKRYINVLKNKGLKYCIIRAAKKIVGK